MPLGVNASWSFDAPPETTIIDYSLYRAALSNGGSGWSKGYGLYHNALVGDPRYAVEMCFTLYGCSAKGRQDSWFDRTNHVLRTDLRLKRLILAAQCVGSQPCGALNAFQAAQFAVYSARVGLWDTHRPALNAEPEGGLFSGAQVVRGSQGTSWTATDRGGGLSEVALFVDGRSATSRRVDPEDADCARITTSTIPCPLAANGTLSFDTARLPDGEHTVQLVVSDIAGNKTSSRAVRIHTANHPTPNGANPSRDARLAAHFSTGSRRVTLPYGKRRRVVGRLTQANGTPIRGARIDVYRRISRSGERRKLVARPLTDAQGRFAYLPPRGSSRTYTLAYHAYDTDFAPAAKATLVQSVRAGVQLTIRPRRLHNGQRMRISGRLLGGPGRKGTIVTMQVLNPRRVTFLTLRADRHGRFRGAYRFRNTRSRYTFRFRAVVQRQPAYPYLAAASAVRRVTVLP